nr:hypothetical protein [Bradyrhizobium sp. 170]
MHTDKEAAAKGPFGGPHCERIQHVGDLPTIDR